MNMKYKTIKLQIKDSQSLMSLDFNNSEMIFSGDFLIINEFKEDDSIIGNIFDLNDIIKYKLKND